MDESGMRYRGGGSLPATEADRSALDREEKRKRMFPNDEDKTNWKLMLWIVAIPFVTLVVVYVVMRRIYREPIAAEPCQGICELTPELLASYPAGCKPENPFQLFYPHIPKTAGTTMGALISSRRHLKSFEMNKMREWRDAAPGGVVWLGPMKMKNTHPHTYEAMFRMWTHNNVMEYKRNHRTVFFGHVFFHNFSQPLNQTSDDDTPYKLDHEHLGISVLRDPIQRLASQYSFDRKKAKSKEFQEATIRTKGNKPFHECAAQDSCVRSNEFTRWCSLQTRYICGWGKDCVPDKEGGATKAMLARAKEHLKELFVVVGVQEKFDLTLRLLEKKLPTYFEGLSEEYAAGNPENCGVGAQYLWQKYVKKEKCPYHVHRRSSIPHLGQGAKEYKLPKPGSPGDKALRKACWADLELYELAVQLMDEQAAACRV